MKFRYAHKRVNALARRVEPTNSSPVIAWPPSPEEKPRDNQALVNLKPTAKSPQICVS